MLAGNDLAARRLLDVAANDPSSRVNRYLAHLFLGALAEGEDAQTAETHYRAALELQPRAQSAHLALSSFLVHDNRMDEARRVSAYAGTQPAFDPWWSYFHGAARDPEMMLAELHSEVCR